ncbi:MAG: prepilin-type N-terminal cleavage/methylation domain-containing protein, partial [Candidatus Moranbacteria bacterium]|nr:prepilin-type N-terminal cleavage/methylation domain-containing protein [Candidatus Moranbacteria bacterium]
MEKNKKYFKRGLTLIETIVAITLFLLGIQASVLVFNKTVQNKRYSMEMGRASF